MHISGEHIDLFERYHQQLLSEPEVLEFDSRIAYDDDFRLQFEYYKQIEQGIRDHFRNEMKQQLQFIDKKMDCETKKPASIRRRLWLLTLSSAAALVLGFFVYMQLSSPKHSELALNYWPPEPGLPVKMGTKGNYDDAMNAYKLEEFDKAKSLLDQLPSDTATYFKGVIAFVQSDYPGSANYLKEIDIRSTYYHEAQFRLALVNMIIGNQDQARLLLRAVADQNGEFSTSAKELLKRY
jgi:hypothetical protein